MININLLPPELKLKKIQAKRNASLMSVCLVIIIITVVLGIIARSAKATIETHLGSTQSDINQNNNTQEGNKNLEDMALLINDRAQETTQFGQKFYRNYQMIRPRTFNLKVSPPISLSRRTSR